MEMSKELLAKAKEAKTPEELMAFAKENNMEMTEESAKAYFEQLHPKTGEITDEELDNVSGGGCHTKDGRLVVSVMHYCDEWRCKKDVLNAIYTVRWYTAIPAAAARFAIHANTAHTKKAFGSVIARNNYLL